MHCDRPVETNEKDRLGISTISKRLASAILNHSSRDGLVIGIEGSWGSGKSSLINLTIEALRGHTEEPPETVLFFPWLVGDRDSLLSALFEELVQAAVKIDPIETAVEAGGIKKGRLSSAIAKLQDDKHWKLKQKQKFKEEFGSKLKVFGAMSAFLAEGAKALAATGSTSAAAAGTILERGGELASSIFGDTSLSKRKSELVGALAMLSRRIVVFVDDLDRLEPREASEMLRLIRAVADFPNVIYVLSYDRKHIAQTLMNALQIEDGFRFLEKIVQVSFSVPRPESLSAKSLNLLNRL